MFRVTLRDLFWLTLLFAVLIAWWLEYRSDALARHRDAEAIQYLKQQVSQQPAVRILRVPSPKTPGLRPVPGHWDYQFPPHLPIRYEKLEEFEER